MKTLSILRHGILALAWLAAMPASGQNISAGSGAVASSSAPKFGLPQTVVLPGKVNLDMLWVPAGNFTMVPSPLLGFGNAPGPRFFEAQVTLTKGFWLGKFEVTQAQWQAVMGTTVRDLRDRYVKEFPNLPHPAFESHGAGPNYPIYWVAWDWAMDFCRKLTEQERAAGRLPENYEYTLPTQAQWEYAARAGAPFPKPDQPTPSQLQEAARTGMRNTDIVDEELRSEMEWYKSIKDPGKVAWYAANSGGTMHPVGQKEPNAWGFYDMLGNAAEWCYDAELYGIRGAVIDPVATDLGPDIRGEFPELRSIRGGSFADTIGGGTQGEDTARHETAITGSRVALHEEANIDDEVIIITTGFRVALAPVLPLHPIKRVR